MSAPWPKPDEAALLGDLQRRRAVGVLGDDVDALVEQRLAPRLPSAGSNQLSMNTTFSVASGFIFCAASRNAFMPMHHFGDLERAEIAQRAGLAHHAGDRAEHGAAFVEARVVGRDVVGALEAGAVLELHIREFLDATCKVWLHEAERGGEDQLAALLGEIAEHALAEASSATFST